MPDQIPRQFAVSSLAEQQDQDKAWSVKPATFLEAIGAQMMLGMLIVIALSTVTLMILWYCRYPTAADLASDLHHFSSTQPSILKPEEVIDLLMKRQSAYSEAFRGMFQLLVLSGLVPIFTLMAGYVFGKNRS